MVSSGAKWREVDGMSEALVKAGLMAASALVSWHVTVDIASAGFKADAFERGYMVECIGKSGYYWECE